MYAVIFKAQLLELDDEYFATAKRLRELALSKYHCIDFIACSENNQEIAISYWPSHEAISAWKNDEMHQAAQKLGATRWYQCMRLVKQMPANYILFSDRYFHESATYF